MAIASIEKFFKNSSKFRGVTLAKMNESHLKTNWNCNSLLQSNKPSFNATAAKMAKKKKIQKNEKFLKLF
jgi:hypothetical protein